MNNERVYMEEILAAIEKWLPKLARECRIAGTGTIYAGDVLRIATHEPNYSRCGDSYFNVWVRDACGKWLRDGFGVVEQLLYLREDYEEGNYEQLTERVGEFLVDVCYIPEHLQAEFNAEQELRSEEDLRRQLALAKVREHEEEMKRVEQTRKRAAMTAIEADEDEVLRLFEEWREKDAEICLGVKNKNTRKKKRSRARAKFLDEVNSICGIEIRVEDVNEYINSK